MSTVHIKDIQVTENLLKNCVLQLPKHITLALGLQEYDVLEVYFEANADTRKVYLCPRKASN